MKKKSHNNKGGSIASNGYKLIFVGKNHHLADIRGYAYEHRIVAEKKYKRKLLPNEQVHHIDGNKLNNSTNNLEIVKSFKHHRFLHRKSDSNLRLPDEKNRIIKCNCGCNKTFLKYDETGRPRKYISGHNPNESIAQDEIFSLIDKSERITVQELIKKSKFTYLYVKAIVSKLYRKGKVSRIWNGTYAKLGTPKLRQNELIKCLCGCGGKFMKYDKGWRERKYISGHNGRK